MKLKSPSTLCFALSSVIARLRKLKAKPSDLKMIEEARHYLWAAHLFEQHVRKHDGAFEHLAAKYPAEAARARKLAAKKNPTKKQKRSLRSLKAWETRYRKEVA
jgi:hypothetical protein